MDPEIKVTFINYFKNKWANQDGVGGESTSMKIKRPV